MIFKARCICTGGEGRSRGEREVKIMHELMCCAAFFVLFFVAVVCVRDVRRKRRCDVNNIRKITHLRCAGLLRSVLIYANTSNKKFDETIHPSNAMG